MTDQTVGVVNQSGAGTLKVDASELTVGANTVERQRMVIADPVGAGLLASVTAGGALKVDGSAVTQPVSAASLPLPAGAATSANQVVALAQGSTTSGQTGALILGAVTTSAPGYTTAQTSPLSLTTSGLLRIDGGSSGAMATTVRPSTANGASISRISTAASGVIKASAGTLYAYDFLNTNAAVRYMQIYNKATAGIPGTDTPVMVIGVPANGTARLAFPPQGAAFATGLSWAVTTDAPGVTAGASGDIVGTAIYF